MRLDCLRRQQLLLIGCVALLAVPQAYARALDPESLSLLFPTTERYAPTTSQLVFLSTGSTLGFGSEVNAPLSPRVVFRVSPKSLRDSELRNDQSASQHYDLRLRSTSLFLDWHPFGGSFRTTLGVLINGNRLSLEAWPTGELRFTDAELTQLHLFSQVSAANLTDIERGIMRLSEKILSSLNPDANTIEARDLLSGRAEIRFRPFTPYVGIGWGNAFGRSRRLLFSSDLGVAFHGSPRVELGVGGILADAAREAFPDEFAALLAREEQELKQQLAKFDVFPVVSFGLRYQF